MKHTRVVRGKYYDSVTLMLAARELKNIDEVTDASLSMATEANLKLLESAGYNVGNLSANPSDLVIALECEGLDREEALGKALEMLEAPRTQSKDQSTEYRPKSVDGALSVFPDSNLALISVAGQYAGNVARNCLERGLNVMLYSDNVPLDIEMKLKDLASRSGLIVMGPDCGTVIIRGTGIGFANACPVGPVGIVAAAGTGLQEVHVQLARREVGVLHGIGTGGRDVKEEIGGVSFLSAMDALLQDDEIEYLVLIGKPPSDKVYQAIIDKARKSEKSIVIGFLGSEPSQNDMAEGAYVCKTLEETAAVTAALANGEDVKTTRESLQRIDPELMKQCERRARRKGYLRGLFSGGTLAFESQYIVSHRLGSIFSNVPLEPEHKLSDSLKPEGNCIIDYGEDEFTQGKLHPMIDATFRCEKLLEQLNDNNVGVVLIDVVIGYGSHPDPASEIAATIGKTNQDDLPLIIAYVCGTDDDPQNLTRQTEILQKAGVVVCKSNAQAALLASEFAARE